MICGVDSYSITSGSIRHLDFSKIWIDTTSSIGDVFLLKEYFSPSNKHFVLEGVEEIISFSFLKVSHKDTLV